MEYEYISHEGIHIGHPSREPLVGEFSDGRSPRLIIGPAEKQDISQPTPRDQ